MEEKLSLLIDLFITITMVGLGLVVYNKKNKSLINRLFLFFTVSLVIWVNFNFFENWVENDLLATVFLKLDFVSAPLVMFFIAIFLINFPKVNSQMSFSRVVIFLFPAVVASIISVNDLVFNGVYFSDDKIGFSFGKLFPFYASVIIFYAITGPASLFFRLWNSSLFEKKQIRLILVGFSIMIAFLVVFNLFLQNYVSKSVFRINTFSPIIIILITGYAILKHQLFNIKIFYAQLLTLAIWALVFLQFFFARDWLGYVVTFITFGVAIFLGVVLIRSVKDEITQKEELKMANTKLMKLDKLKSEFISMASHQLRTPLAGIKGFISIMRKGVYGEIPERFNEPIDHIENSNERLIHLVEDMLNVSQIEAGRMEFKFKKENISHLVEEIFDSFILMAEEKKLTLEIKKTKGLPKIPMDYGKMREVVSNIVDNAIKYTKEGGVKIETRKSNNNKLLEIVVTDTGIGIEKEGFEVLFDKFSRGKEAQEMKKSGVGLGLYLGKKIIEAHRGKIKVKSEGRDKGATFIIQLPIFKNNLSK